MADKKEGAEFCQRKLLLTTRIQIPLATRIQLHSQLSLHFLGNTVKPVALSKAPGLTYISEERQKNIGNTRVYVVVMIILLVTVAERSKACTIFARSDDVIVGSNSATGMNVWCLCVRFSVFVNR
jgi:hypothetical protein